MRPKSKARLAAEELRREQWLTYSEISKLLGINKSTLSYWLRDIVLSPEQEKRLQSRIMANRNGFAARVLPINKQSHQVARQTACHNGAAVIDLLPDSRAADDLALAILYLGEGLKTGGRVQLANTDVRIIRFFIRSL